MCRLVRGGPAELQPFGDVVITEHEPADWRDLQAQVARILSHCGFAVAVEKKIRTARGFVAVDVYAREERNGRKYLVLCECKYWKNRVPKSVVHSFQSVVANCGANVGYLVSSSGFQSGAFDAAEHTNLKLLTWQQFQDEFQTEWVDRHFRPVLEGVVGRPLDCFYWLTLLRHEEVFQTEYAGLEEHLDILSTKYLEFLKLSAHFMQHRRSSMWIIGREPRPAPEPPMRDFMPFESLPPLILETRSYLELLDAMVSFGEECRRDFEVEVNRCLEMNPRKRSPF